MKRIFFVTLLSSVFVMAACGNQPKTNIEKEKSPIAKSKTDEAKMGTISLTKADFLKKVFNFEENPNEWKYLGDKPSIVDFYADWCPPCRAIAPILEELAKKYHGQIYIYKVDTDEERELASAFGIRSLPTLLFIPMNGQPQMAQGAMPKESFIKAIEEVLLQKNNTK